MKLPFQFGMKLVYRMLLPGFILALAMAPLVHWVLHFLGISTGINYLFVVEVAGWGWVILICDMHIYMLFEGRRYWPTWASDWGIRIQERRLERLSKRIFDAKTNHGLSQAETDEAEVEYGLYPVNEGGTAFVKYPTRIGNIIEMYETYPDLKYGLDGVFYWDRLWVVLDKDLREENDSAQAVADSTVYVAFALYLSGVVSWLYGLIEVVVNLFWPSIINIPYILGPKSMFVLGAVCFPLAFCVYKLSLPVHAKFRRKPSH